MKEENVILKFDNGEGISQKVEKIIDVVNWLCHEMQQGRVNNNNLLLTKETENLKTPLSIAFVKMAEKGEIDEVTASGNANLFVEWDEKSSYKINDLRQRNGMLYKCLQPHTGQVGWEPENTPALWKLIGIDINGIPYWSQPISQADSYMKEAETSHNNYVWISDFDYNVWEPGVYGWHVKENHSI